MKTIAQYRAWRWAQMKAAYAPKNSAASMSNYAADEPFRRATLVMHEYLDGALFAEEPDLDPETDTGEPTQLQQQWEQYGAAATAAYVATYTRARRLKP
jgi:hypothetical protein